MMILALTGGIASGKSTVAKLFQKHGAAVLNADRIAHETYRPGTPLHRKIRRRYGKKILGKGGTIDRQALAKILFHSLREKKWLESHIHPLTRESIGRRLQSLIRKKKPVILVEAALHVETGYYRNFPFLVVVTAEKDRQIERLVNREGLSRAEARSRIRNQLPASKVNALADWLIDNSGSLSRTESQVKKLMKQWKEAPRRIPIPGGEPPR